jgi:hypothetical protein
VCRGITDNEARPGRGGVTWQGPAADRVARHDSGERRQDPVTRARTRMIEGEAWTS